MDWVETICLSWCREASTWDGLGSHMSCTTWTFFYKLHGELIEISKNRAQCFEPLDAQNELSPTQWQHI